MDIQYPFYFAVPNWASRASRERVPAHLAKTYGVLGKIELVRAEGWFRLYRVVEVTA